MDIDKAGILVVNYSERLVTLLREVRQLSELGHSIPPKISKVFSDLDSSHHKYDATCITFSGTLVLVSMFWSE